MIRLAALTSLVLVVDRWPSGVSKELQTLDHTCLDIVFAGVGRVQYDVQTTTPVAFLKISNAMLSYVSISASNLNLVDCLVQYPGLGSTAKIVALNNTELWTPLSLDGAMLFMQCPGQVSLETFTDRFGSPYVYSLEEYEYSQQAYNPSEEHMPTAQNWPGILSALCPDEQCVNGVCFMNITGRTRHRGLLAMANLEQAMLFDALEIYDSYGSPVTYDAGYSPYAVYSESEYTVIPTQTAFSNADPIQVWYANTTAVVCLDGESWVSSGMQDVLAITPGDALWSNHPLQKLRNNMSVVYITNWSYSADQRLRYSTQSDKASTATSTARCKIARYFR